MKTILITGATAGIGEACALKFGAQGHRLILTGRRQDRLDDLVTRLRAEGVQVTPLCFDVTDKDAVDQAIASLTKTWREIDVLINNAGLAVGLDLLQGGDVDDWERMIDTNIKGLLYMTRTVAPLMVERKQGHIINISSIAGKDVYKFGNVYCATKHAVDALSKAMRIDMVEDGIKVTNIAPGMVETEFSLVRFKGDEQKADKVYQQFTPLYAEDIADAIVYVTNTPAHVCINDMIITPTAQANPFYTA
ncbi:MAG: SDR family NAD(P)-dependent oxidoreductase [Prolixibacteraceae bacterium]|jgi:NADP-dependent 3-hydroxy acid dehydrogenase YdfG|nr:SDR family NAD(P)-dependent oxidoreductase [Prolixibacteraceae bacterium]